MNSARTSLSRIDLSTVPTRECVSARAAMKNTTTTGKNEPEKRRRGVVRVVGDAVEAAGIGLILDDEVLEDEQFGERDHRAIDAVDVALEGDNAEEKARAASEPTARRVTANGVLISGVMKPRQLGQAVPFHEIGKVAAVARRMSQRVIDLERQRDEVGADAEIDRLAEAENAGKAPDQVDAEREDRKAEELAEQRQHVGVRAVIGIRADQAMTRPRRRSAPRAARMEAPDSGGAAAASASIRRRQVLQCLVSNNSLCHIRACPSASLIVAENAPRHDADDDNDEKEHQQPCRSRC